MAADIDNETFWFASMETGGFNALTGPGLDELGTGAWLNITGFHVFGPSDYTRVTLDNVVVAAAVPIPAAVWLFGSALAGLGWLRRKPTV